jgi:hypothetical protein
VLADSARGELTEAREDQDVAPMIWPWSWYLVIGLILVAELSPWLQGGQVTPRMSAFGVLLLLAALVIAGLWYARREWLRLIGRYLQRRIGFLMPRRQRRLLLDVHREGYGRARMVLVDPLPWPRETRADATVTRANAGEPDALTAERDRVLDGVRVYFSTPGPLGSLNVERVEPAPTDPAGARAPTVWSAPDWGAVGPFAVLGVYLAARAMGVL